MVVAATSKGRSLVKARLYTRIGEGRVRCDLCARRCVIEEGARGWCRVRRNVAGDLYTSTYSNLSSVESRPIEIKPFFHYWPGSTALTFSTWSCNLDCPWCQNYHISKRIPDSPVITPTPSELVSMAVKYRDQGLCASFQEPTLLAEYSAEAFSIAKSKGLYCCFVSNGYMTREALRMLVDSGLDGINIDLKGPPRVYEQLLGGAKARPVLRSMEEAVRLGIHLEVVCLIVTGVNDDQESIEWLIQSHLRYAGESVPLHFTRYHPAYRFRSPPPDAKLLERAVELAREKGVLFPYVGNMPGHRFENTYCPWCGRLVVVRSGFRLAKMYLDRRFRCPGCGETLPFSGYQG